MTFVESLVECTPRPYVPDRGAGPPVYYLARSVLAWPDTYQICGRDQLANFANERFRYKGQAIFIGRFERPSAPYDTMAGSLDVSGGQWAAGSFRGEIKMCAPS